jgi:hypothetical protein
MSDVCRYIYISFRVYLVSKWCKEHLCELLFSLKESLREKQIESP